jgi:hypothetical protein
MNDVLAHIPLRAAVGVAIAAILILNTAAAADAANELELKPQAVLLKQGNLRLPASLTCPKFTVEGAEVGVDAPLVGSAGDLKLGKKLERTFAPIALGDSSRLEVKLLVEWSAEESLLRKWAAFRLVNCEKPKLVSEVVLEDFDLKEAGLHLLPEQPVNDDIQSRPVFLKGFFTGIEYPVAQCRVENGRLRLFHRPGLRIKPGDWHVTRKAIYGITPPSREKNGFKRYIEAHRPLPKGSHHFLYNPYWSTPTTPSQDQIMEIMRVIGEEMYKPHGVTFDSCGLTVFTTDTKSIWKVDKKRFPRGLTDLQEACDKIGSRLDIFLSPSSMYPPALDPQWAEARGYETFDFAHFKPLCLAGKRYQSETKNAIVDTVVRYGANHVFVDGYLFDCPATNHGHEPGIFSREAVADGLIDIFAALRKASPDVWLAPTCFTKNPSPWWCFYANSVIGCYGDDAPYGRVPSPAYRESYTTARDYFNLQGAHWLAAPIAATESFGIIHQSDHPLLNDAVTDILRGNMEQHCAINPDYMNDLRWKHLASVMKWARQNAQILQTTEPLLPRSWQDGKCPQIANDAEMPREPYGYAHWGGEHSLVLLRNPWIEPQSYKLKLAIEPDRSAKPPKFSAVSIYPEPRVYGSNLKPGDTLDVQLAPYETVVLSFDKRKVATGIPLASKTVCRQLKAKVLDCETSLENFSDRATVLGPDFTCLIGNAGLGMRVNLDAEVTVDAPDSELLILLEDKQPPVDPVCEVRINGREATVSSGGSETGWAASTSPKTEWWLFLSAPLPQGKNRVNLNLLTRGGKPVVSAWVWAKKAGDSGGQEFGSVLPQPEVISLDGVNLLKPVDEKTAAMKTKTVTAPFERINGVFLDAIDQAGIRATSGNFLRNTNAAKTPITIAGRRYLRGLGANAPSKITVSLNGEFRRFQSWVGLDSVVMANYMDRSAVTFEVWVDGQKRWDSGVVKNTAPAQPVKWVDVDVTGAKLLELMVVAQDLRGHHGQNLADWADARLLK